MHGSNRLASQYHQLTPRERLQLMLEAQARDDAAEVQRLWETCPVKAYRHADAAFDEPHATIEKMSLSFGIETAEPDEQQARDFEQMALAAWRRLLAPTM